MNDPNPAPEDQTQAADDENVVLCLDLLAAVLLLYPIWRMCISLTSGALSEMGRGVMLPLTSVLFAATAALWAAILSLLLRRLLLASWFQRVAGWGLLIGGMAALGCIYSGQPDLRLGAFLLENAFVPLLCVAPVAWGAKALRRICRTTLLPLNSAPHR